MINILSLLLFLIFLVLGGFHFYWFFGGNWGLKKAIPTKNEKTPTPSIPKFATLLVGFGLVFFGFLYLFKIEFISILIPNWIATYAYWFVPSIFLIRAIGDFKYVGLFKKIKNTEFAKADSKLFIPLCFTIGILGFLLQFINQ